MRAGVDFGTTHTVVALVDRGNYPVVSFEGGDALPSVVAARGDELRFGEAALALLREPGWDVLRSFKRLLDDPAAGRSIPLGGREWPVSELLAAYLSFVLTELRERSNAGLARGEPVEAAVAVPASASSAQRLATVDAFRQAGFTVKALLNEPSAAGFEYAHRFRSTLTSRREYVLVYDLGGGTFDASLLHLHGRTNEVVTSAGVPRLGGDDFDAAILGLFLRRERLAPDARRRAELLEEVRLQKEAVNANTRRFTLELDGAAVSLPIDEVYAGCAPLVEQTLDAMEPVLRDPRDDGREVGWTEIAGLYVVGGASNFPAVYRRLRERFGAHRVHRSPHPGGSCAIGLAIHLDESAGFRLAERLTRHFGVFRETEGGGAVSFDVLVPRDTPLPAPGEPPLVVTRSYRAAHNVGHYRYVECARVAEGRPEGNLLVWDELRVPFDPALSAADLASVPVRRAEGPEVEERYSCAADGSIEARVRIPALEKEAVAVVRAAAARPESPRALRRRAGR